METPDAVWQDTQVIAACHAEDLGRVVALWRNHPARASAVFQGDLADRLGVSQTTVSRVESGVTHVDRLSDLRSWAAVLGMPAHLSWFGDYRRAQRTHAPFTSPSANADAVHRLLEVHPDNDDQTELVSQVGLLRQREHVLGAGAVLRQSRVLYRRATVMLQVGYPSTTVLRQRLRAAAEVAGNHGWICLDSGDLMAAETHCLEAIALADEADSVDLQVYSMINLSAVARHGKQLRRAREILDHAQTLAARLGLPHVLGYLARQQAVVSAQLGDHARARQALRRSEISYSRTSSQDVSWMAFDQNDHRSFVETYIKLLLTDGRSVGSDMELPQAPRNCSNLVRNALMIDLDLVTLRLTAGAVEQAALFLHRLAENPPAITSYLLDQRISALLDNLAKVHSKHAHQALEHWADSHDLASAFS